MVDITPLIRSDRQVIQGYKNGVFKISNVIYEQPVIVFPDRVEPWPVVSSQIIAPDDEDVVANDNPSNSPRSTNLADGMASVVIRHADVEFLLLGTGLIMHPIQPALRDWFKAQGVRCEFMDTGAACRTYNVLMAEGRLVAAALLPSV